MSFANWTYVYVASFAAFIIIDLVWLGVLARGLYRNQMGDLLAESPRWPVAIAFYLLFVFGICWFAVAPGVDADSLAVALRNGALFGLLTYATYDLTNLAVLRGFPVGLTFIDMAWGTVLSSAVTTAGFLVARAVSS